MDVNEIWNENLRRNRRLKQTERFDAVRGTGSCGRRTRVPDSPEGDCRVPQEMTRDAAYDEARRDLLEWRRLRIQYDFEYWCATCVRIRDKETGRDVPFVLNVPQRRVTAMLEDDRRHGRPMRLIMLKARQWGGSTLVQMYMAWMQCVLMKSRNSLIVAHVKDAAATIRGMYTNLLEQYPTELWDGDEPPAFKPFEHRTNVRRVCGRRCTVTIASADNYDSVRSGDYAMAHLSETAYWLKGPRHEPQDIIRAVCGSILTQPNTLVVMESTANGVGNFFHKEWLRCAAGKGDKRCVFVPWHEIKLYRLPVERREVAALMGALTPYEQQLWADGCTLEQVKWYHMKALEYQEHERMAAEYPGSAEEAFMNNRNAVFSKEAIKRLRTDCTEPLLRGDIDRAGRITADSAGLLHVWARPRSTDEYIVAVDVGGRSASADYSVIAVLSRTATPEVVAQWRGHLDHDWLADKAVAIARAYNDALLVVESNTLETQVGTAVMGDSLSVLERLTRSYGNLYRRQVPDMVNGGHSRRVGFHTNRRTKPLLVNTLNSYVRDHAYTERDQEACNELATYVMEDNGAYAAQEGHHDDILMTRALALYVMEQYGACEPVNLPDPDPW